MKGRNPTASEKRWMQAIRQVGCIACIEAGRIAPYTVPEEYTAIHHIDGQTKPNAHMLTIPLCAPDHQTGSMSVHGNRRRFESEYGTELELLEKVKRIVEVQEAQS